MREHQSSNQAIHQTIEQSSKQSVAHLGAETMGEYVLAKLVDDELAAVWTVAYRRDHRDVGTLCAWAGAGCDDISDAHS